MKINKHLLFLFYVIAIALLVALAIKYFDSLQQFWLWFIGLIGGIAELMRRAGSKIASFFSAPVTATASVDTSPVVTEKISGNTFPDPVKLVPEKKPDEKTTMIKVLRYTDDGETTLGLLYIDDEFYCYTLEDTFREIKVQGKTRIPAGTYNVDFIKQITPLTLTYRKTRDWFDYHLEIKNVPGFTGVYIHNGGTSADTEGCLLIAHGISANNTTKMLTSSRQTFEEFYKLIGHRLRNDYTVTITIYNENWIDQLKH
jgi:hypothetical protein